MSEHVQIGETRVARGRRDGPRLFVAAAVHGDELNGVEIIRRLLRRSALARLHGTLIAVPMVNVYGFIHHLRHLPDRRDLNRAFPGSERGERLGATSDSIGQPDVAIRAPSAGIVIGRTNLPLVHEGEALYHLARFADADEVADHLETFQIFHDDTEGT